MTEEKLKQIEKNRSEYYELIRLQEILSKSGISDISSNKNGTSKITYSAKGLLDLIIPYCNNKIRELEEEFTQF